MAKLTTDPIGSFSQSAITTLNTNFDRVEAALEKTLSRDGTSPNQMTADFDMNDNDILNVGTIDVDELRIDGALVVEAEIGDASTVNGVIPSVWGLETLAAVAPVPVSNGWMNGRPPSIIERATPKLIMPEMFLDDSVQIVYAPAPTVSSNNYNGATDFTTAFNAMGDYARSLLLNQSNPDTSAGGKQRAPFALGLQPGMRYRLTAGANLTAIKTEGLVFDGGGGTVVGDYQAGYGILDLVGSSGIHVMNMRIESNNTGQPNFGICRGRRTLQDQCDRMMFTNVYTDGWFRKAAHYNGGGEGSTVIGGDSVSYGYVGTPPTGVGGSGYWIDSRNELDIASYTQATGVTRVAGDQCSCIGHTFINHWIRSISGCEDGALRITTTPDANILGIVRGVRMIEPYLTNGGKNTNDLGPAIVVDGTTMDAFEMHGHAEPANSVDTGVNLSHLIYFKLNATAAIHHDWSIHEYLSDAELATFDKNNSVGLNILDIDLTVTANRGVHPASANLFGTNMSSAGFTGRASHREVDASLMNYGTLAYFHGDIFIDGALSNVSLATIHTGRIISRTAGTVQIGQDGTWTPTIANTTNLDSTPTPGVFTWSKIGTTVYFDGRVLIDPTLAASTLTSFTMTQPTGFTSNFVSTDDASGVVSGRSINQSGVVSANTTSELLFVEFPAQSTGSYNIQISGKFIVK